MYRRTVPLFHISKGNKIKTWTDSETVLLIELRSDDSMQVHLIACRKSENAIFCSVTALNSRSVNGYISSTVPYLTILNCNVTYQTDPLYIV